MKELSIFEFLFSEGALKELSQIRNPDRRGFGSWPSMDRSTLSSREFVHRFVLRFVDESA